MEKEKSFKEKEIELAEEIYRVLYKHSQYERSK